MAESVVCFVDADEAVGRGGIAAVVVWVVALGEIVELTVNVLSSCCNSMNADCQISDHEGMLKVEQPDRKSKFGSMHKTLMQIEHTVLFQ